MNLCRFKTPEGKAHVGMVVEDQIVDLSAAGVDRLSTLFESEGLNALLNRYATQELPRFALAEAKLLAPVDGQEVWAAGVTYLRSKKARMEESDFSATAYDKVYEAPRPELFFKAMPNKVVASGEPVGIRRDAKWNVPEPELVLILNSHGHIAGYSIGNDMSSRDIEGENLLYLPQAKIYDRSCAMGPFIRVGVTEAEARTWGIQIRITRAGEIVFKGETSVNQIKRSFGEMADYLFRSQTFSQGAALLTGTGIVPPNEFTLRPGDRIQIEISGIGELTNDVREV
ncbi:MAG TPA: fumarylacetoacetate hydrolase family protein [Candidatus Saccharimonadales bacterium]|nr:fumarylacetoacetate hydrolase family protein [Candidatus Saccharimonadales bacterium]